MINKPLLYIILTLGLLWAKISYAKFASGNFVAELGISLSKVQPKNPYPFFKEFLSNFAIPNSQIFGTMVLYGEALVAISLILGSSLLLFKAKVDRLATLFLIAGLLGGLFLNINFWLGFGWTSPSTDSLNLLMGAIEGLGIFFLVKHLKTA
ncbi:MAG: hypothetical protein ACD_38C00038G0014 [uncultured bacterium]|nr:MAG: hypothetical protein ACD_38C00038G0014 [uncultured bacterium]KKR15534.1 MAG: DoxX family protein [Candidatus Daviesbacteria bacterium GW2011_GWA2_39_33]KKR24120.1 MAG: DoxX family protein [Candidatus Daviesbacteria bacterium GW2011_GWB1_39_5]OGE21065.1 MAG: hypothetical protein A2778_02410 [Candidatus Daviesbacteria bacterium RIFCSPHIGHO2_01_FULL_40_24]OGE29185.1 MAG: hypothetical protein A3C29_05110 [Candidatus Daviesbacteria bacterium RIFCSPHIGHO2_02_FULL_40_16]OGE43140.1 MAG: hypoth